MTRHCQNCGRLVLYGRLPPRVWFKAGRRDVCQREVGRSALQSLWGASLPRPARCPPMLRGLTGLPPAGTRPSEAGVLGRAECPRRRAAERNRVLKLAQ